jgi:hypothetical protein
MSHQDHIAYGELMQRYSNSNTGLTPDESALIRRADLEVRRYLAAEKKWAEANRRLYFDTVPVVHAFIERMRRQRKATAASICAPSYRISTQLDSRPQSGVDATLLVGPVLLHSGVMHIIDVPAQMPVEIPHVESVCAYEAPTTTTTSVASTPSKWVKPIHPAVSRDAWVMQLLSRESSPVDFAMSESALLAVFVAALGAHDCDTRIPLHIARHVRICIPLPSML